jgi:L-seryl-tRNA(Ser) seleniumtransferase
VGSGALPVETLPSFALAIHATLGDCSVESLSSAFRALPVPVIGRIHADALLFDLRCLAHEEQFVQQLDLLALT